MAYPWYATLTNSDEIRQGDFIPECPIIIPPTSLDLAKDKVAFHDSLTVRTLNTIVLSQSCDLEHEKVEIVLVSPFYYLDQYFQMLPQGERIGKAREKRLAALKQGNLHSLHLLNTDPVNGVQDYCIVDFRNVYGVNLHFLKSYVQTIAVRPRLLPPYREHLSQAFARFFMRVGLPNDITGLE